MADDPQRLEEARTAYTGFVDGFRSLFISSIDDEQLPSASYAPFVRDPHGNFYVFVSLLAEHTRNLLDRPRAAIMLIENEEAARQIFARRRATFRCRVEEVPRDTEEAAARLEQFRARFGDIMDVLGGLGDFRLLRLVPTEGRFVIGFGQAYRLTGESLDTLEPIGPGER